MIEPIIWLVLLAADTPAVHMIESRSAIALHNGLSAQERNSITGSVFNQSRRPIEKLRVELLDEVDGVVATTYTNGAGQFAFYRLSTGTFQVRVLTTGTEYESRTERVTITGSLLGGRGSQSEQVDIVLRVRKERGKTASASATRDTVFVQEVPNNAREAYEQAIKDIDNDKSKEKALAGLQRAVELFPDYYAALDLLGQEYVKRENYAAAQSVLTKAVTINPRSYSSWYALGYAQYKLRLLPAAVESLGKAASLNSKSVNAHLVLGTVQRLQKQWGAAETHLKQAKSLSKTAVAEIHWQLALLYNQTRRFTEAADELELFLNAQPDSRDAVKIRKVIGMLRQKK